MNKPLPVMFDKWVPDNTFWNQRTLYDCRNVVAQANGFAPIASLQGDGNTIHASLRARGAKTFRLTDSNTETLAGIKNDILLRASDGTWTSIGDAVFATDAPTGFWSMDQFGALAIMVNGVDTPRKWNFVTGTGDTAALGGSPPAARYVVVFYDFVVLGHLDSEEDTVHWSGINDPEEWTVGTQSSDKQQFPNGGRITGLFAGQRLIVLQERKVRMGIFAPGSPEIIQFDVISEERGCVAYRGAAQIGEVIFFLADDGFYVIQGGSVAPISDEVVARWFTQNVRNDLKSRTVCSINQRARTVMWSFFSADNQSQSTDESFPDKTIIYHWPTKRWSYGEFAIESPLDVSSVSFGLEDLDAIDDLDSLTISLDAGVYNTEILGSTFAGFSSDNQLADFSGANMEARFSLLRQQLYSPERQIIEGVHVSTDASVYCVALRGRSNMADSGSLSAYVNNEPSGWCPHHSSARMHDVLVKIPAAQSWSFCNGLYLLHEKDGEL